jgi:hypothetical protein
VKLHSSDVGPILLSGAYVFFVHSGLIKWVPGLPLDPTILFAGILLVAGIVSSAGGLPQPGARAASAVLIVLAFFAWYYLTASYTVSTGFWSRKAVGLTLDLAAFSFPLIAFRTKTHFVAFEWFAAGFGMITALVVLGIYWAGAIDFLIFAYLYPEMGIPDYLGLATVIGISMLIWLSRDTTVGLVIALACVAAMLLLTARGPILFSIALVPFALGRGEPGRNLARFARLATIAAAVAGLVMFWEGARVAVMRFSVIGGDGTALDNALRVPEFSLALQVIGRALFMGVGLGGYGLAAYGIDVDSYPHNLFLEAFAEGGIIAFLLFSLSAFAVAFVGVKDRRGKTYLLLFVFMLLNYIKSGGFIGARDLYMTMGVLVAYAAYSRAAVPHAERAIPLTVPQGAL